MMIKQGQFRKNGIYDSIIKIIIIIEWTLRSKLSYYRLAIIITGFGHTDFGVDIEPFFHINSNWIFGIHIL